MKVELDTKDLVSLVIGTDPYYSVMEDAKIKGRGFYMGGFHDKWSWYRMELEKLSEEELYDIYLTCKKSWK